MIVIKSYIVLILCHNGGCLICTVWDVMRYNYLKKMDELQRVNVGNVMVPYKCGNIIAEVPAE